MICGTLTGILLKILKRQAGNLTALAAGHHGHPWSGYYLCHLPHNTGCASQRAFIDYPLSQGGIESDQGVPRLALAQQTLDSSAILRLRRL